MSRPRKPTQLKILTGTLEKSRIIPNEPKPQLLKSIPHPPANLKEDAKTYWVEICEWLLSVNMLHRCDFLVIEMLSNEKAIYDEAMNTLRTQPYLVKAPSGYAMINPNFAIKNKTMVNINVLLRELGMTPQARTRISTGSDLQDDNPFLNY